MWLNLLHNLDMYACVDNIVRSKAVATYTFVHNAIFMYYLYGYFSQEYTICIDLNLQFHIAVHYVSHTGSSINKLTKIHIPDIICLCHFLGIVHFTVYKC